MSAYRHGIYITEQPTSIMPPVKVDSALPVFFVTAPLHLTKNPYGKTHVPTLCYSYKEAVETFGFSMNEDIWDNYTICEAIYSLFVLYGVAPAVFINVLDPEIHTKKVKMETYTVEEPIFSINSNGVLVDTIDIRNDVSANLVLDRDYTVLIKDDGLVYISIISDAIQIGESVSIDYTALAPEKVDIYDIVGGYDIETGTNRGLELINEIYPRFRLVPSQIVAPYYSSNTSVAAVMETKAGNINGHFKCMAINDLPTMTDEKDNQKKILYTEIPAWKSENNYTSTRQYNLYPKVNQGDKQFNYSSHMAGLIMRTDYENNNVPCNSPSNKKLKIDGLSYADGESLYIGNEQANYLNSQGVSTAINFPNSWVAWGNRTGSYPETTDVKDSFISVRRMFDWIGNTITLTFWNKIDQPITNRRIYSIVDSINMWFNGLAASEYILGGHVTFLRDDNQNIDLIDGKVKFRVNVTPAPPMESAEFVLEYDTNYLSRLFE